MICSYFILGECSTSTIVFLRWIYSILQSLAPCWWWVNIPIEVRDPIGQWAWLRLDNPPYPKCEHDATLGTQRCEFSSMYHLYYCLLAMNLQHSPKSSTLLVMGEYSNWGSWSNMTMSLTLESMQSGYPKIDFIYRKSDSFNVSSLLLSSWVESTAFSKDKHPDGYGWIFQLRLVVHWQWAWLLIDNLPIPKMWAWCHLRHPKM